VFENDGKFAGADVITLQQEQDVDIMYHPLYPLKSLNISNKSKEQLLHKIMENGRRLTEPLSLTEIAKYSSERLALLPAEYKRFDYAHSYKVGLSESLRDERDRLIGEYKK